MVRQVKRRRLADHASAGSPEPLAAYEPTDLFLFSPVPLASPYGKPYEAETHGLWPGRPDYRAAFPPSRVPASRRSASSAGLNSGLRAPVIGYTKRFSFVMILKRSCRKLRRLMGSTSFVASAGSLNILLVPSSIREYINEKSTDRGFNLESFEIRHETDPHRVVVDLLIGPRGAEQLEPFKVSLVLGDAAARQLTDALQKVLPKETT